MFGDASVTPSAVFASEWHADHTVDTEVLLIKPPLLQQGIDRLFLLSQASKFGYIAWLVKHGAEVKVAAKDISDEEESVRERQRDVRCWQHRRSPSQSNEEQSAGKDTS